MRPRVSVVLCVYNCALIRIQLASILSQDELPDELIVIDDSTDGGSTWSIIQDVLRSTTIERKVVRNSENIGMRASYEKGLRLATCEIVATCDHDDVWMPTKLRVVRDVFAVQTVTGVVHDVVLFEGDNFPPVRDSDRLSEQCGWRSHRRFDGRLVPKATLLRRNRFSGTAMAFRRAILDDLLPFPDSIFPDYWIALVVSAKGGLRWIDEPLVHYRRHSGNTVPLDSTLGKTLKDIYRPFSGIGEEALGRLARMSVGSVRQLNRKVANETWRSAIRSRSNRSRAFRVAITQPGLVLMYPSVRSAMGDCLRLFPTSN